MKTAVCKVEKLSINDYHEETIKTLKKARNAAENKKAQTKITAVIMCWKGKSANQIAKDLEIHVQTACRYINAFNEGGLEKLLDYKKSPGRKTILTEQEMEMCKEMFMLTPEEINLAINVNWDTGIMQEYIFKEYGKKIDRSNIYRMLKKLGFSYTRPTYTLARADKKNHFV
jgi:transposase